MCVCVSKTIIIEEESHEFERDTRAQEELEKERVEMT